MSKHRRPSPAGRSRLLRTALASAAATAAALAGCSAQEGTPDDDGYSGGDWASEFPGCTELWVEGNTLPDDYRGCLRDSGGLSVPTLQSCSDGGDLVRYDGLFARAGEEITAGDSESAAYQQASDECG